MTATIDSAGRVVIPKALRDRAGLTPGTQIDFSFHDGTVEIRPCLAADEDVTWEEHGGILYPVTTGEGESLGDAELNDFIRTARDERIQQGIDAAR
jgi:AbrB family looped-hinge helix DNA binding protein